MSQTRYAYTYNLGSAFMGTFDSVKEALTDADDNYGDSDEAFSVYVGQVAPVKMADYAPDASQMIEHMMEVAYDNLDEAVYLAIWDRMEELGDGAKRVLTEKIETAVEEWQDDFKPIQFISSVVNIERYEVGPKED